MTLIKTLHGVASITHIISAILVVVFANRLGWLIANEFATAVSHAIGVYLWWSCKDVTRCKQLEYTRRWIEYAVTAGLLEVAILDTDDVPRILTILALNAVLQVFGWILDARGNALLTGRRLRCTRCRSQSYYVLVVQTGANHRHLRVPVRTFRRCTNSTQVKTSPLRRRPYLHTTIYYYKSRADVDFSGARKDRRLPGDMGQRGRTRRSPRGGILLRVNTGRKRRSSYIDVDA